eukprot:TRINITY_DN16843_c0_g1_i1.p1 TRINITY_DN16843_c0_g1~~TRINITY_DN16843_c0_g1_i1.p1  ORF type:complete len:229 (-),score=25.11 TRINITY_DN16843_c0_g1_i1:122-808(-)
MDGPVLSYGPVVLRHLDVDLLKGPHFLNDQIIEFFFHYLTEHNAAASAAEGSDKPAPLLLVGPALTFWLLHCPDSDGLKASIEPMHLPERELLLFALNNNEDVEAAEGGTHWSLLVYSRQRNIFEHFDSMSGTNWRQARALFNVIKPVMGPESSSAKLSEPSTPQQENSYDCGVYVMAIAEVISNAFEGKKNCSRDRDLASLLRSQVSAASVRRMRSTTLDLIDSLQD